jgi:hypothetical protein
MRTLPETIAYLRTVIAANATDRMVIEASELAALCDEAEKVEDLESRLEELSWEDR